MLPGRLREVGVNFFTCVIPVLIIGDVMENQKSFLVCKIVVFCLVVSFLAGFGGCSSNKSNNAVAGAVLGGVLGGGIGALAASSTVGASTAGYVAVGAAVGAGTGAALGAAASSDNDDAPTKSVVKKSAPKKVAK